MPEISIIVPIYNVEKYLERCVESILNQTFEDFEIILVNDGSTDKSGDICDRLKFKDYRIKVVHKENGGVSSARNKGLEISNGEFITFIDPDDYIELDALGYIYNLSKDNNAEIGVYKMNTFKIQELKNINKYKNNVEEFRIYEGDEIIKEYIYNETFLHSVCNKIYSRSLISKINLKFICDIRYAEDALFNYNILSNCNRLVYSNLRKYNYCINNGSVVNSVTEKRLDILKAQKQIYFLLKNKYNKYTEVILNQYANSSILIVLDIARESMILKKIDILKKVKNTLKKDKDILKDLKINNFKQKIYFKILKISPLLLALVYKIKIRVFEYDI